MGEKNSKIKKVIEPIIGITFQEAVDLLMEEYKGAWEAMADTEDIERWKRTDQYRREIRQGLHKPKDEK